MIFYRCGSMCVTYCSIRGERVQLGHRGQINTIVAKAQCFVTSAKNSTKCDEVFSEKSFNFSTMNKTRWSSMHQMLMSIISADDRNLIRERPKLNREPPTKLELNILREICEILQPVALFTTEMQATHGTSGMLIPALNIVFQELDDKPDQDPHLSTMDNSLSKVLSCILKERFEKILADKFFWIGTCLDPRFGSEALENVEYLHTLKSSLNILLEFEKDAFQISDKDPIQESTQIEEPFLKRRKSIFSAKSYRKDHRTFLHSADVIEMEITLFRAEARNLDGILELYPISWWEGNSTKLPLMAKLAKVYLLPPASTADVERLFSVAGRICRPHRSRLNPKTIEILVTLKYRLLSENQAANNFSKLND